MFRAQCVTFCGLIPTIVAVGAFHPEVLVTLSDKIFQRRSIIRMDSLLFPELISSSWKDTIGVMIGKAFLQSFSLLFIILIIILFISEMW